MAHVPKTTGNKGGDRIACSCRGGGAPRSSTPKRDGVPEVQARHSDHVPTGRSGTHTVDSHAASAHDAGCVARAFRYSWHNHVEQAAFSEH